MPSLNRLKRPLVDALTRWLVCDHEPREPPQCDFERLCLEIRAGDVILVEGRSRVSEVISWITLSPWTHSVLYVGRLRDIDDPRLRARIGAHYRGDAEDQLIIEALLGEGVVVAALDKYRRDHLRICRPRGLTAEDTRTVLSSAMGYVGNDYDFRQIVDLARFFFPWSVLPRRLRSSLFQYHAGAETRTVCSSMIARAFMEVRYPILPVVQPDDDGALRFYPRNFRLFTPRDFDFSPYFEIVKYPMTPGDECVHYRDLPWDENDLVCNGLNDCFSPQAAPTRKGVSVWSKLRAGRTANGAKQAPID